MIHICWVGHRSRSSLISARGSFFFFGSAQLGLGRNMSLSLSSESTPITVDWSLRNAYGKASLINDEWRMRERERPPYTTQRRMNR